MSVFILLEFMGDGRGGCDSVVRGVYANRDWALTKAWDLADYDIQEWEVDTDNFS
jgi:hypothetical protein